MTTKGDALKKRPINVQLRWAEDEHLLVTSAARHKGLSFAAWARLVLLEQAKADLDAERERGVA